MNFGNYAPRNSADYIIKQTAPKNHQRDAYLSGDFKFAVENIYQGYIGTKKQLNQWTNYQNFAKRSQWIPINHFLTYNGGPRGGAKEKALIKESAEHGVIMIITSLRQY